MKVSLLTPRHPESRKKYLVIKIQTGAAARVVCRCWDFLQACVGMVWRGEQRAKAKVMGL